MEAELSRAADVTTEVRFLGRILDDLADGRFRIPRFQRPFVWRPEQIRDLLDSIQRRYPIGSILTWETTEPVASAEEVGPVRVMTSETSSPISYVLDGQQRLTSLLGTLRLSIDTPERDDQERWFVWYDLRTSEFIHRPKDELAAHHFPIASLLSTGEFLSACRRLERRIDDAESLIRRAEALADAFRNYTLPVVRIRTSELNEAVEIFARLNTRGQRLTADQMVAALSYSESEPGREAFNLAEEIDNILDGLGKLQFGGLDRVAVLRSVLAALEQDIYYTDWTRLVNRGEVRDALPSAVKSSEVSLYRAAEFLHSLKVTSDRLLPYAMQMVFLGEFFRLQPDPDQSQLSLLQQWFWVTSYSGWFALGNPSAVSRSLAEFRQIARGQHRTLQSVDLSAPALPFPDRFDARSARVRTFLIFLCSLQPRSPIDGSEIPAGRLVGSEGPRALNYIYSSRLSKTSLHASPANRILIGVDLPNQAAELLRNTPAELREVVFASHCISPSIFRYLESDDAKGFVQSRLDTLVSGERSFMQERGVVPSRSSTTGSVIPDDSL